MYVKKEIKYVKTKNNIALYEGLKRICKHGLLSEGNEHSMSLSNYEKTLKLKPLAIQNLVLLKVANE